MTPMTAIVFMSGSLLLATVVATGIAALSGDKVSIIIWQVIGRGIVSSAKALGRGGKLMAKVIGKRTKAMAKVIKKMSKKNSKILKRLGILTAGTVAVASLAPKSYEVVEGYEAGVRTTLGAVGKEPLKDGPYLTIPGVHKIYKYDAKVHRQLLPNFKGQTKDRQTIEASHVLYLQLDKNQATDFYIKYGHTLQKVKEVVDMIVMPTFESVLKEQTNQYNVLDFYTDRDVIQNNIQQKLNERLKKEGFVVSNYQINDMVENPFYVTLAREVMAKRELAMQQEITAAKLDVEQAIGTKTAQVAQAVETAKLETERAVGVKKYDVATEIEAGKIGLARTGLGHTQVEAEKAVISATGEGKKVEILSQAEAGRVEAVGMAGAKVAKGMSEAETAGTKSLVETGNPTGAALIKGVEKWSGDVPNIPNMPSYVSVGGGFDLGMLLKMYQEGKVQSTPQNMEEVSKAVGQDGKVDVGALMKMYQEGKIKLPETLDSGASKSAGGTNPINAAILKTFQSKHGK